MADYTDVAAYVVIESDEDTVLTFPASFDGYKQAVVLASCLAQATPEHTFTVGKEWVDGTVTKVVTTQKAVE
jgi:hypothetical protein